MVLYHNIEFSSNDFPLDRRSSANGKSRDVVLVHLRVTCACDSDCCWKRLVKS